MQSPSRQLRARFVPTNQGRPQQVILALLSRNGITLSPAIISLNVEKIKRKGTHHRIVPAPRRRSRHCQPSPPVPKSDLESPRR